MNEALLEGQIGKLIHVSVLVSTGMSITISMIAMLMYGRDTCLCFVSCYASKLF